MCALLNKWNKVIFFLTNKLVLTVANRFSLFVSNPQKESVFFEGYVSFYFKLVIPLSLLATL